MPKYIITERAGRFVAATTNTGIGTMLELTERAAAHELRLGTLIPASGPSTAATPAAPAVEPAAAPEAPSEPVVAQEQAKDLPQEIVQPKPRRKKAKAE